MRKVNFFLMHSFLFVFIFTSKCQSAPNETSEGQTNSNLALLVGVNKYPYLPSRYQLSGCVNDVHMMEQLLKDKFQYNENNIHILTDEQATRNNILSEFKNFLIDRAQQNSQVVFYFSGHGSQMTDLDLDESDKLDETIVPHDSRDPEGKVIDITDDTLGKLLQQLTYKCKNVTIIMDCCHSGSGVRNLAVISKKIPALILDKPISKSGQMIKDGPSGFSQPNPDYVLLSACADNESAYESYGHGVLTYNLNKVMRKHPNATYREIMYKVVEQVNTAFPSQHPQLEGKRRDARIFGNLGIVEKFIEVTDLDNNNIQLNAGSAHNVTKGSVYAIYKPGTTTMKDNSKYIGKVKVSSVEHFTSIAEIEQVKEKIVKNAAAFKIQHHYGDLQLRVHLDSDLPTDIKSKILEVFRQYKEKEDLAKLVTDKSEYDISIHFDQASDKLQIEKRDMTHLAAIDIDDLSIQYELTKILTKEARIRNIYKLENKDSGLKVRLNLKCWENVDENLNPINEIQLMETEGGELYLNTNNIIKLQVKNESNKSVYIYLLDLGTDGSVTLLFPAAGAQDSPLLPGNSMETGLMRIVPPEGLNGLKLIATTIPTDFSVITQAGYQRVADSNNPSGGIDSPLGKLLNMAWGGNRNVENITPKKVDDWTTDLITFNIIERK